MSFPAAKKYLGLMNLSFDRRIGIKADSVKYQPNKKPSALTDPDKWAARAANLVKFANDKLLNDSARLEWLRAERGLTADTARRFKLGWLDKNYFRAREEWGLSPQKNEKGRPKKLFIPGGLIIPRMAENGQVSRIRIRKAREDDYGKYYVLPGSDACPLEIGVKPGEPVIVVESELDGLLLAQEILEVAVIALGSVTARPDDDLRARLAAASALLIALDSDEAGGKQSFGWWLTNFHNSVRTPIPTSYGKDPCEAYRNDLDLTEWFGVACKMAGIAFTPTETNREEVGSDTADLSKDQLTENFNKLMDFFDEKETKGKTFFAG